METRVKRVFLAICLGSALFWALAWYLSQHLAQTTPLLQAEYYAYDQRVRYGSTLPENPNLVFLGVDESSYKADDAAFSEAEMKASRPLQLMGTKWPWSREVWGHLIDKLSDAGACVIVLDFLFPAAGDGDDYLAGAIKRHPDKVVLAAYISQLEEAGTYKEKLTWPSESIVGSQSGSMDRVGLANFWPDSDEVIRSVLFNAPTRIVDAPLPVLAAQALNKSGDKDKIPADTFSHRFRFTGSSGHAYQPRSIYEIFVPALWQATYGNGRFFKDKIVIVGPAGNWSQDFKKTPFAEPMYGPQLHLNAISAALAGAYILEPGLWMELTLILCGGLLAFFILNRLHHPVSRFLMLVLSSFLYLALTQLAYDHFNVMLIAIAPLLSLNSGGGLCLLYELVITLLEKARTRAALEKYVSHNVVKEIIDRSKAFEESLGGTRKPCTMLFSDIRGFTSMTESDDSQALVAQLNDYLTEMVECVFRYEGTLDKFIGDAVMAVWGNVKSQGLAQDAVSSVNCALDMLESLKALNLRWSESGRPAFEIGIGINHGEVIVGNMGSHRRKDFTVIGDAVNLASRLEGITKEYQAPLVIGESVEKLVRDQFHLQTIDLIRAKGKSKPVLAYHVLSRSSVTLSPERRQSLELHEQAFQEYSQKQFNNALTLFRQVTTLNPENKLANHFALRCENLLAHPPEGTWDGVYTMENK